MAMHIWLADPGAAASERRRSRRRRVCVPAQSRGGEAPPVPVTVTDLTAEGCRIEGEIDLSEGAQLWLGIPGIAPRRARVAWARRGEAGCEFFFPVRDDLVEDVARGSSRPA
jgi:hypothetical protein